MLPWIGEGSDLGRIQAFIMHLISVIVAAAPPQIIRNWILEEAGDPCFTSLFFFKKEKTIHVLILLIASSRFFVFRVKLMSELGGYSPREGSQVPAGLGSDDRSSHELCDLRKHVLTGIHTCVH